MSDWLHCNTCFNQPGDGRQFFLTGCAHIFCDRCQDKGWKQKCMLCGTPNPPTHNLTSKLTPTLETYFSEPSKIIKRIISEMKQLLDAIEFQHRQRKRFFENIKNKVRDQKAVVDQIETELKKQVQAKFDSLQRELSKTKEENAYLQKLLIEKSHGGHGGLFRSPQSKSPGFVSSTSPRYPYQMGRSSSTSSLARKMSPTYGMTTITPNRISVRTPPIDGRMGIIPPYTPLHKPKVQNIPKSFGEKMEHNALLDPTFDDGRKSGPMEKLTHIELSSIQCTDVKPRTFNNANSIIIQSDDVETSYGNIHVAIQGERTKPAIFTYHDIGLNHITCFQGFFNHQDMQEMLKHFCVYHLNAPGQEEGAMNLKPDSDALGNPDTLGKSFVYPSMDELAEAVLTVADHFGVNQFIGFAVGSGSNVLSRFALTHPSRVDSLVLVNPTSTRPGWIEWGYQKMNSWYLWSGQVTNFTEEYLLWHWFGSVTRYANHDLVTVFKDYVKSVNPQNLSLFTEAYLKRTDLNITRELDAIKKAAVRTVKCRTLILVGDDSPHLDDVVSINGRMDPEQTELMKIADCGGMPLEEQPGKVAEAFRFFLQGMGYVPTLRIKPTNHQLDSTVNKKNILSQSDLTAQPVC